MTERAEMQWKIYKKMVSNAKSEIESGSQKPLSPEQFVVSGEHCEGIVHLFSLAFYNYFVLK